MLEIRRDNPDGVGGDDPNNPGGNWHRHTDDPPPQSPQPPPPPPQPVEPVQPPTEPAGPAPPPQEPVEPPPVGPETPADPSDGTAITPAFFGIDDFILGDTIALLLAWAMASLIAEMGWDWVLHHRDQVPDLLIGKLPGWIGDKVDKVKDWVGHFFSDNKPPPSADRPHPEWGKAGHADQLPKDGDLAYVPPKRNGGKPKSGNQGSYVDDKGRIWTWDKGAHGGPHWDVVDPRTNKHANVYPDGHVR